MQMDVGLDTGAMISKHASPISTTDTTATLHDRLAQDGARLIVEALIELERDGKLPGDAAAAGRRDLRGEDRQARSGARLA